MPDGEGEDVLLPSRRKPPDIWHQITMIRAAQKAAAIANAVVDIGAATTAEKK